MVSLVVFHLLNPSFPITTYFLKTPKLYMAQLFLFQPGLFSFSVFKTKLIQARKKLSKLRTDEPPPACPHLALFKGDSLFLLGSP